MNVIEDLDEDGIEDFYDSDDDGDGFSDAEEIAYGSDPRDPDSVANTAPRITLPTITPLWSTFMASTIIFIPRIRRTPCV